MWVYTVDQASHSLFCLEWIVAAGLNSIILCKIFDLCTSSAFLWDVWSLRRADAILSSEVSSLI